MVGNYDHLYDYQAIAWLEDLQQKDEFVGTESRFLQIFALLKETQERSTTDIEVRITQFMGKIA